MSPINALKKYRELILPLVICLVIPWLDIINSFPNWEAIGVGQLMLHWLRLFLILMSLWYANAFIINRFKGRLKWLIIFPINILLLAVITNLYLFFGIGASELIYMQPPWFVVIRVCLAVLLFITIQASERNIKQNERLKTENYALQTENYKAQLDQLKKQVNPHFLFNSLSTLQTMIRAGNDRSEEFVFQLSDVYRRLLQTKEDNTIALKEELEFLEAYLYLLKSRHDEGLEVILDIPKEAYDLSLPSFGLQLLVENATKHNIISEKRSLKIHIFQKEPNSITVSNNLQLKKNVPSLGVGLNNLRKRYELMNIEEGVLVEQDDKKFSVTLKLF
ncbi:MAG: histidine kinase [Bacteroidota bacterium]